MQIAVILKALDMIMALVNSGFTFDAAFKRISDMIAKAKGEGRTEITEEELRGVLDGTDQKIVRARALFDAAQQDANTPPA